MRIAYFSPLNPVKSGISDYSEELLPYLAERAEIDLFVDGYKPANKEIADRFAVHDAKQFRRLDSQGRYDSVIYHMGNSPAHAYIYDILFERPGIVVLHDFVLHHLIMWLAVQKGRSRQYMEQMQGAYGPEGANLARRVLQGQLPRAVFDYPLSEEVIRRSTGLIVHSRYVEEKIREVDPSKAVKRVNMGMPLPDQISKEEARANLGLDESTFVISSIGHLNPYKRIDSALRAFKGLTAYIPDAKFLLVGSASPNYDPKQTVRLLGLDNKVSIHGFAEECDFWNYVFASDVCLNLRYPTAGETSAAALRLMAAGRPVIVSNTGAFMELPGHAVIKVDVDDTEEEEILENLLYLARMPSLARAIGYNARNYIAAGHSLDGAAGAYIDFIMGRDGAADEMPAGETGRVVEPRKPDKSHRARPMALAQAAAKCERLAVEKPLAVTESCGHIARVDYIAELAAEAAVLGVTEEDTTELEGIARVVAETIGGQPKAGS